MDLQDVAKDMVGKNDYQINQRMSRLMKANPNYKNLGQSNRKLVLSIIDKYKDQARHGIKPSFSKIKDEKYHLYKNRLKLGLSPEDLKQTNKLLDSLK